MKKKDYLILGFALFSMFFGAGNLIFPPTLGLMAGENWLGALLGFLTTGVGLTFLAIYALTKTEGSAFKFGEKVSGKFSFVFNSLIILAIGPLLAMPRTGAVTYEMAIQPFMPNFNPWIFQAIYFGLTIYLAIKPSKMMDRLGEILTPIILGTVALIIGVGLFKSFGHVDTSVVMDNSYFKGFQEGYQTMDAIGAIIMGVVAIDAIRARGVKKEEEGKAVLITAGIAGGLLALIYGGLMFLGAKSGSVYAGQEIGRTALLSGLATLTLGTAGKVVLGLLVASACLTTSVGLAATAANFFSKHTKIKYGTVVIVSSVISLFIANFGVDKIIKISVPLLVIMYPIAMVLIVLNSFSEKFKVRGTYIGGAIGAGAIGLIEALNFLGVKMDAVNKIYSLIPLSKSGFAFIVPAILGAIIFTFIIKEKV